MPRIYTSNFPIEIKNKWYTDSSFFWGLVILLTLVLPALLAAATNDFLLLESIVYEQPNVKFTNEMIVEVLMNDGTTDKVYQYSTIQNINNKFSNKLTAPRLSVNNIDDNNDYLNENIEIELKFAKTSNDFVKSIHVLFYLQYFLGEEINTQFKTLVYKQIDSANGKNITFARMKGPLVLKQKNPVAPGTMKREVYNSELEDDYLNYGINGIIDLFQMRNQTVKYNAQPLVTTYGITTETKLRMDIQIPTIETVNYASSALQVLKGAWIQYLAFFIPIYVILYVFLYGFVVKSNVLN